jgi:hypothetical protein
MSAYVPDKCRACAVRPNIMPKKIIEQIAFINHQRRKNRPARIDACDLFSICPSGTHAERPEAPSFP